MGNSPFFKILNLLLLTTTLTFAQINTSVQTVVQVLPPYTLTLSDYTSTDMDKLHVALFFNDPTLSSVEVKLRIRIESDKLTLITKPEYIPPKLILEERDWLNLTGADLADYFKPENLNISGSLQQGRLPEGLYRFCIEVLEYKRGVSLSNMTCSAPVWMVLNDPPIWQLPRRNETVEATFPQNLLFNWLPRHTGSPNSLFEVEYELHVEPIYNENVNLQALPLIQNTFQAIETDFPSYIMNGGDVLQLEPGQKYAAWVKAKDKSGKDLFRNNGVSEVIMFTFGQKCETPSDPSIVTLSYKQANLSWTGNANNNEYTLSYHEKGQDNNTWYGPKSLYLTSYQLNDLKSNTQYEVKLKAACNTLESEETSLISFTTPTPPVEDFNCNDPHAKPRLAKTKKKSLSVGDVILLRGANLKIVEVTGGDGVFSGKGILTPLSLAMLQKIGLEATFSNIGVNEDNKLTDGVVQVISGPVKVIDKEAQENVSRLISSVQQANTEAANQKVVADVDELLANSPKLPVFAKALITQGKDQIAQGQAMVAAGNTEEGQKQIAQGKLTLQKGLEKASLAFSGSGGIVSLDAKAKTLNSDPNITITFDKTEQTQYGYDAYKEPLLKSKYEAVTDNTTKTTIYPAWKALESGKPDVVKTTITAGNGYKADSVYFENENGNKIAKTADALTLIGGTDGSDIRIYATYPDKDGGKHVAQLNTASYDKVENKVYLIPLNGTTLDAQQIQTILNAAYKQAVASFTVVVKPSFTLPADWDEDKDGKILVNASGLLSNYTKDMNNIIKAYKAANDNIDKEAFYLFIGIPASDAEQKGYMPRAKNFGFIFGTDLSDKTIAHELGHGAFHLKHTFDETSVPQGSSQNLMDYGTGTFLNKYQWDYVHNPAFVIGLFESDKAGAMTNLFGGKYIYFQDNFKVATTLTKQADKKDEFTPSGITNADAPLETLNKTSKTIIYFAYQYFGKDNIDRFETLLNNRFAKVKDSLRIQKGITNLNILVVVNCLYDADLPGNQRATAYKEQFYPVAGLDQACTDKVNGYLASSNKKLFVDGLDAALKERADKLKEYLDGCKVTVPTEIKIVVTRTKRNSERTTGTFNINNGALTGYILEREKGTDEEATSSGSGKRIQAGTYNFLINNTSGTKKAHYNNKTLRLTNVQGRDGILLHWGNDAQVWSEGCLLGNKNNPINFTQSQYNTTLQESEDIVRDIVNYVKDTEELIKLTYKVATVTKQIIIKEDNETEE